MRFGFFVCVLPAEALLVVAGAAALGPRPAVAAPPTSHAAEQ